jgi:DNA-binding transcriptional ArsR family regulator
MPQIQGTPPLRPTPTVQVRPSVAIELEWALGSGGNAAFLADNPVLTSVYAAHPELRQRVHSQWAPDEAMSCFGFFELLVLAHRGRLLFTSDGDALIDRLDGLCTMDDTAEYPFRSETAEDAVVIRRRLEVLRSSPERRAAYVVLVSELWQAVRDVLTVSGWPAVEAAIGTRRLIQATGAGWREVARSECDLGPELDECVAALAPGGEVVVVPAYFTHRGLFIDLPDVVVIGVRTDTTGAEARARTESLAHRLKAVSDPTRLALVDTLRRGPRTVTELSVAFGLAQPTVSNHVKVLREAGLVSDARDGTRRTLRVEDATVAELLEALRSFLTGTEP